MAAAKTGQSATRPHSVNCSFRSQRQSPATSRPEAAARSCDLMNSCMWYSLHRNLAQVTMMREIDDLTDLSHLPE